MLRGSVIPWLFTLVLHSALAFVLLLGWQTNTKALVKKPAPNYMKAKVLTVDQIKSPKARKPVPQKKQIVPKKQTPKVDKAAEAKKQEALRKQKLAEQKRKQVEQKKRQAEAERKKQQAKREKERIEKQRLEKERLEKQRRERQKQELAQALAAEEAELQAATDAELASSYVGLISEVISNNWNRPPSARNSMQVVLRIQMIPTGEVTSVAVVKSSGDAAFDRSAENAVKKAGRFAELQQLPPRVFDQYFRRLTFTFTPEDLRL